MICLLKKNDCAFVTGTLDQKVESYRLPTGEIAAKYQLRVKQLKVNGKIILWAGTVTVDDRTRMARHCKKHLKPGAVVVVDGTLADRFWVGIGPKRNINISAGLVVIKED